MTYQGKIAEARGLARDISAIERPEGRASPLFDMATVEAILVDTKQAGAQLELAKGYSLAASDSKRVEKIHAIIEAEGKKLPFTPVKPKSSRTDNSLGPLDSKFAAAMHDLSRRKFREAIHELKFINEKDDDPLYAFFLGRAYMMTKDWEPAIDSMKSVQDAKGRLLTGGELPVVAWPLSFYYMGVCYEELGLRSEAISSYQKFLELWKAADSDLPHTSDARRRLHRLSALKPFGQRE